MTLQQWLDKQTKLNTGKFYDGFVGVSHKDQNCDLIQFEFDATDLEREIEVIKGSWSEGGQLYLLLANDTAEDMYIFANTSN